jgi:hypothetical protein
MPFGIVNLLCVHMFIRQTKTCRPRSQPLGHSWEACDVLPAEESWLHLATVCGGGEEVASWPERLSHGTVCREEVLFHH